MTDAKPLSPQNEAHRQRQALCAPHSPQWRKQVRLVKALAKAGKIKLRDTDKPGNR